MISLSKKKKKISTYLFLLYANKMEFKKCRYTMFRGLTNNSIIVNIWINILMPRENSNFINIRAEINISDIIYRMLISLSKNCAYFS